MAGDGFCIVERFVIRVEWVLFVELYWMLVDYVVVGGGWGFDVVLIVDFVVVIDELVVLGLRGRGGAGFLIGIKWWMVLLYGFVALVILVVVNAVEGEFGCWGFVGWFFAARGLLVVVGRVCDRVDWCLGVDLRAVELLVGLLVFGVRVCWFCGVRFFCVG